MTYADDVERFAKRHSWPIAKARDIAEARVSNAVEKALAGSIHELHLVDDELREEGLQRYHEAINERRLRGEATHVAGSTGA